MSTNAATSANPHITRMLNLITPPMLPDIVPVLEAPRLVFANLSPFFEESRRARQEGLPAA